MIQSISKTHPFKFALMAGLTTIMLYAGMPDASAAGYTVQQINIPGLTARMSNNGAIVGNYSPKCTSFTYEYHQKGIYCYQAPWFYDGKSLIKLGTVWSNTRSAAADINDSLQLTGSDGSGAWTYSGGAITRMTGGTPAAINNAGVAVGNANVNLVSRAVRFINDVGTEVFDPLFNDPNYPDLSVHLSNPATPTSAVDINNSGLIAGSYKDAGNIKQSYVVDTNDKLTLIPNLGGTTPVNCEPTRISETNPTTGETWVAGNCLARAFVYELTSGILIELANLPGAGSLSVISVNSSGEAVGVSTNNQNLSTAVMWSVSNTNPSNPTDLNANQAIAPTGGAYNLRAVDINEAGDILTDYIDSNAKFNAVLLKPIP